MRLRAQDGARSASRMFYYARFKRRHIMLIDAAMRLYTVIYAALRC